MNRWEKSLLKRIENYQNREILLIGNDLFTDAIEENLKSLKKTVRDKISVEKLLSKEINIDNGFSDKCFILMAQYRGHKEVYEYLIDLGLEYQKDFALMGLGGYIENVNLVDPLLMFNRSEDIIPGIKVYGNINNSSQIVAVSGNSTSDPYTGGIVSWPELLYNNLVKVNPQICLLNCAMTGYTSTQEFLKFNRDVLPLKPDIYIMMSGYNDIQGNASVDRYPFLHKYQKRFYDFLLTNPVLAPDSMDMRNLHEVTYGLPCVEPDYRIWLNNVRKIKAICDSFEVKYVPYLQPMVENGKYQIDDELRRIFIEYFGKDNYNSVKKKTINFCECIEKESEKNLEIHNIVHLLDKIPNAFYDTCHCNEQGNLVIATKVFHDIKDMVNR